MEVEEENDDTKAKKAADELKTQGNAAYKSRKFEEAIEFYEKAWETYPKDVTYLTNLSGECYPPNATLTRQRSTSRRESTRSVSRLLRRLSRRVVNFVPTTRPLPRRTVVLETRTTSRANSTRRSSSTTSP